ncbi:3-ketoacyl-CoA thiolase, peroxisomal [Fonsecaea pedrosoi]|nr:3-ketoacyl-CoA thiolase, peroxisomal [Fonsecaea pedrosoi]
MCRSGKGAFKDVGLDGLCFKLLEQVRLRSHLEPSLVNDIILGNVRDGKAAYYIRAAALGAGFPNTTTATSTNRFCSSGLTALQHVANEIKNGIIEIGIAVGAETLSEGNERLSRPFDAEILAASREAADCMIPMGGTSEFVAQDFNITREQQDRYAAETYRRAYLAQENGWTKDEIVPITVRKDGREVTATEDEVRPGTTYEGISKIRPAFPEYGNTTHAGNASQIMDGAAAVLLMKRSKALELKQPILGKYVGTALAGVPPRIMGIGPVYAIPKLLARYNLSLDKDIDVIEINEAFASMAVYCRDQLKLDWTKMNPRGGAIAIGHPFGCTGVRQVVTGLSECKRQKKKILLTSMCLGSGMGMAGLFVNEQL